jgi:predicted dehydrogenase
MADGIFRLAIIGAGGIAGAHAGAIKASPERLALSAVVDLNADAAAKLAQDVNAKTFASAAELFKANKAERFIDGVIICTPPSARIPLVELALKHGVPVLSEKPLAHTLADAKKLASLSRKYKKTPAFVGYCHRFVPAVHDMLRHTAGGKIGTPVRWENAFACDLPGHETKWFSEPKKSGGGAYLDMGSHSIDLFHFMAGPSKTLGAVFTNKWKGRTETAGTVLVKSVKASKASGIKPGVAGSIYAGWAETCRFTLALVGDKGMFFYDYEKPSELVFKDLGGKAEVIPCEAHDVRFNKQLVAFADAVQKKAKTHLASFDDGVVAAAAFDVAMKLSKKK